MSTTDLTPRLIEKLSAERDRWASYAQQVEIDAEEWAEFANQADADRQAWMQATRHAEAERDRLRSVLADVNKASVVELSVLRRRPRRPAHVRELEYQMAEMRQESKYQQMILGLVIEAMKRSGGSIDAMDDDDAYICAVAMDLANGIR